MFGIKKEINLLKDRVHELESEKEYWEKMYSPKKNGVIKSIRTLSRIVKYSKEGEPTFYFYNQTAASDISLYIDKEEYLFEFNELRQYYPSEVSVNCLEVKNNIAYLTVTGKIRRHVDKPAKTYSFIVDYKNQKYILSEVVENKYIAFDDGELPCT